MLERLIGQFAKLLRYTREGSNPSFSSSLIGAFNAKFIISFFRIKISSHVLFTFLSNYFWLYLYDFWGSSICTFSCNTYLFFIWKCAGGIINESDTVTCFVMVTSSAAHGGDSMVVYSARFARVWKQLRAISFYPGIELNYPLNHILSYSWFCCLNPTKSLFILL